MPVEGVLDPGVLNGKPCGERQECCRDVFVASKQADLQSLRTVFQVTVKRHAMYREESDPPCL